MTRTARPARYCRVEAVADAPIESVWAIVSDVTRTGEWSHECRKVGWVDGAQSPVPGARFTGRNRSWIWRWTRTSELIAVDAPRRLSWRTIPTLLFVDSTDWCLTLEADDGCTRIVQTFEVTKCPRWWEWVVAHVNKPHIDRSAALNADLQRLASLAEATSREHTPTSEGNLPS